MCGDSVDPIPHLKFEKMQAPFQNQEGACVERRQRRLNRILANQHEPSQKELFWQ